jgi:hypothetical protein
MGYVLHSCQVIAAKLTICVLGNRLLIILDTPFADYAVIPIHSEYNSEDEDGFDDGEGAPVALPVEKASVVCGFDDAVGACTFQQPWPCECPSMACSACSSKMLDIGMLYLITVIT